MPLQISQFGSDIVCNVFDKVGGPTECFELINEGMSVSESAKDLEYWLVTGPDRQVRMKILPTSVDADMDKVQSIKLGFHHLGAEVTFLPAAIITLYAGSPLVQIAQKNVNLNTLNVHNDDQLVFTLTTPISRADYLTLEVDIDYERVTGGEEDPPPYETPP